jgi:hypothetical protein
MAASCYLPGRDMGGFTLKRHPFLGLKAAEREPAPVVGFGLARDLFQPRARQSRRRARVAKSSPSKDVLVRRPHPVCSRVM